MPDKLEHKKFTPPWNYQNNIDLTNGDWVCPRDVVIGEMRVKNSGTVRTLTRRGRSAKSYCDNYDIFRIDISRVQQANTSPTLYKGNITVYGHYIIDVE